MIEVLALVNFFLTSRPTTYFSILISSAYTYYPRYFHFPNKFDFSIPKSISIQFQNQLSFSKKEERRSTCRSLLFVQPIVHKWRTSIKKICIKSRAFVSLALNEVKWRQFAAVDRPFWNKRSPTLWLRVKTRRHAKTCEIFSRSLPKLLEEHAILSMQ